MQAYSLGTILRDRRKKLGLSQEVVCSGICEPMTLSRFETGKQNPSQRHIIALFQRLGLPTEQIVDPVTDEEVAHAALEQELQSLQVQFEQADETEKPSVWRKADGILKQLDSITRPSDRLGRQTILRAHYVLGTADGAYPFEEGLELLMKAIRMTVPKFNLEQIGVGLYTKQEVLLISNIAMCHYRAGQHEKALKIEAALLSYLKEHLEYHRSNISMVIAVAYNYALELSIQGRHSETLIEAKYTQSLCINYFHYEILPSCLAIQAYCQFHLGDRCKSEELYRQAHCLFKVIQNDNDCKRIEKAAKYLLDIDLS